MREERSDGGICLRSEEERRGGAVTLAREMERGDA